MANRFSFPPVADLGFVDEPPIVKFWNALLSDSLKQGRESLRIEPPRAGENTFMVRACKDGVWEDYYEIPAAMFKASMQRLKIMAGFKLSRALQEERGVIPVGRAGSTPLEIRVTVRLTGDGAEEAALELPPNA